MKKITIALLLSFMVLNAFTQIPSLFKYQAIIRKADGSVITNQSVSIRISLLSDSVTGRVVYSEIHNITTNTIGLINLLVGGGTDTIGSMNNIDWSASQYFIKNELDESGGSNYTLLGINQLLPVPFALFSNKTNTRGKFEITGTSQLSSDSALFEVKDKNGYVVFAVYEGGAELNVNPAVKGAKGGFVVGGRTTVKGSSVDNIMTITSDSVRFYIDNSLTKGSKGGFAVGGRTTAKGTHPAFLHVTQDSSRIYTTDTIAGFSVGSLNGLNTSSYMHLNPYNYFIGQNSGEAVTIGNPNPSNGKYNIALGFEAAKHLTSGAFNILIGYNAGLYNTTGSQNTACGANALYSNTSGYDNTAIGTNALNQNIIGLFNVAIGTSSLINNTTGSYNAAIGAYSLYNNTTGGYNTVLGTDALNHNTRGTGNVAIGESAMHDNDTASYNTAVGASALYVNTSGTENTAIGNRSLSSNTIGSYNTAIGDRALNNNMDGSELTAIGIDAMYSNISGKHNIAVGPYALWNNTIGNYNTANGYNSLNHDSTGSGNTAYGEYSLFSNKTGNYNTSIGYSADVSVGNLYNATAIGYNAIVSSSNKVVIGDANVTSIGGYALWTNYSDLRLKENIIYKSDLGLNFIKKLHTVSYTYKADKSKRRRDGLIAQDVQEILKEMGIDFSGLVVDSDSAKTLNLSYSDFVIPLINAVQELGRQNEDLQKINEEERKKSIGLQSEIMEIKEMIKQKGLK